MKRSSILSAAWVSFIVLRALSAQETPPVEPPKETPAAEAEGLLPASWMSALKWRSIGPANMGGRITALAVSKQDPMRWWASTASGGLLRTTNNGTTFEHQFDRETVVSIGDVQVARSNHDIVWVGTGEGNPRNSVSWGNGVHKSEDGGKTWKHMGLDKTFQIGRMAIHPTNPDIVYVGALGRLWGANEERGLYKTTDGGKTWERILFVDDLTGVIELKMHPTESDTLLAAMWERKRDGFDGNDPEKKWGKGSGLFRTTDGGKNWDRMSKGLPSGQFGRIGIDWWQKDPNVVFMVLESELSGKTHEKAGWMGVRAQDGDAGAKVASLTAKGPAEKAGLKAGDIVVSVQGERVLRADDLTAVCRRLDHGTNASVEILREKELMTIEVTLDKEPKRDGEYGDRPLATSLGGQNPNLQSHQRADGHEYGGVYRSADAGQSWTRINSLTPRPMYFSQIRVDPNDEKLLWVCGVSLHRSKDGGKTFDGEGGRGTHADHHGLWIDPTDGRRMILGNDGGIYTSYDRGENWDHLNHVAIGQFYHVDVDTRRNYSVYGGLQDNGSWGGPSRTATARGPVNDQWISVGGGDGFICRVDPDDPDQIYSESQNGAVGRRHLDTGERGSIRPEGERGQGRPESGATPRYRFNWQTPYILSKHNPKIVYLGANHVFRSLDRGKALKKISPEITRTDKGSATVLAESTFDPDILFVGTDDGAFHRTKDGGREWVDLFKLGAPVAAAPRVEAKAAGETPVSAITKETPVPAGGTATNPPVAEATTSTEPSNGDRPSPGETARTNPRSGTGRRGGRGGDGESARRPPPSGAAASTPAPATTAAGQTIAGLLPDPRWVTAIVCSKFNKDRVYATFDGHRSNDDRSLAFASDDGGDHWRSLTATLPSTAGSVRTIVEDIVNEDILYLGSEFAAWVSLDRGNSWTKFNGNLPTVAVHAFAQNAASGEIVAATHGRSLWIVDATPLRQITNETVAATAWLYKPANAVLWKPAPSRGGTNRRFAGENPPSGGSICYSLGKNAREVTLEVRDLDDVVLKALETKTTKGLHAVTWDLRRAARQPDADTTPGGRGGAGGGAPGSPATTPAATPPGGEGPGGGGFGGGRGGRGGGGRSPRVQPGTYKLVLNVDGKILTQLLVVEIDPDHPKGPWLDAAGFFGGEDEDEE